MTNTRGIQPVFNRSFAAKSAENQHAKKTAFGSSSQMPLCILQSWCVPARMSSAECAHDRTGSWVTNPSHLLNLDVFCTRPFFATCFVERDLLTFAEVIEVHAFNAGRVKEQVLRAANVNETEAFVGETFDRTFCHFSIYSKEFLAADAGDEVVLACRLPRAS